MDVSTMFPRCIPGSFHRSENNPKAIDRHSAFPGGGGGQGQAMYASCFTNNERCCVCVRKRGGAGGDNTVIGGWEAQRDDARSCKHCHRRRNHPRHQPLPSFLLNVMALGRPLGMQRRKTYTGEERFPRGCLQESDVCRRGRGREQCTFAHA